MKFNDYFSTQAKEYSKYRPKYPPELFKYLSSLCSEHKLAADFATGSGQAAIGLTPYFDKIIASDASASQIKHAEQHPKINYKITRAESSGIKNSSADLITIATAIHWVNTVKFYKEVKRILKPGGIIAVWVYGDHKVTPEVKKVFEKHLNDMIKPYWPKEINKAMDFEKQVDFPFERIKTPNFKIQQKWDLHDFLNYLFTWSSVQNYIKAKGKNPFEDVYEKYKKAWGGEKLKRKITWQLRIKVGRV